MGPSPCCGTYRPCGYASNDNSDRSTIPVVPETRHCHTRGDEDSHWPALQQPTAPPLRSLLRGTDGAAAANAQAKGKRLQPEGDKYSRRTSDRVNSAVRLAFDRLWQDEQRPHFEEPDSQAPSNVDGFIKRYFHHVADLSRESAYQAHQLEILHRMREDVAVGERAGNTAQLDELIQRVNLDDRSIRSEIANLMRIAESSCHPSHPFQFGWSSWFGNSDYPPVTSGGAAIARVASGPPWLPPAADRDSALAPGECPRRSWSPAEKNVAGCKGCATQ
mmetsp:Transcript_42490/g.117250  ORF Transcript_42490/g.117250 Transcript_42490/m.117250 type:complete len:276 (+) Transcript_42490:93-920(+)